jgi:hypothetical protein
MFSELPKLFDRNFAIGFFLPVAIFFSLTGVILSPYLINADIKEFFEINLLMGLTILGLISWVGGIVLLAINRDLYRFLEGYGTYNPVKLLGWFEQRRYQQAKKEKEDLDNEYLSCLEAHKEFPDESNRKRNRVCRKLAEEFPDRQSLLLPTPFGNALRSFETYPRVMYGIDSIPAWGRLLGVLPTEFVGMIEGAKAQVDFWVNLGLVFILLQIEYIGLAFVFGTQLNWWIVGLWIVLGTIAPLRATSSARDWGDYVKSAFDVFIPRLRESLGFELPENREEEFKQWQKFSLAMIYRLPEQMPELKKTQENESNYK